VKLAQDIRTRQDWHPPDDARTGVDLPNPGRAWDELGRVYDGLPADSLAALRRVLPPREHLALLDWLKSGRGAASPPQAYVEALLHHDLGEDEAAVTALMSATPDYRLRDAFAALHQELTGEPYGPLSERDPWAYRTQVLHHAEHWGDELAQVSAALDNHMGLHRLGVPAEPAAFLTVSTGRRALAERRQNSGTLDPDCRELEWRLTQYEGELLASLGKASEAVARLQALAQELPSGHALRGRALVELAAALVMIGSGADEGTRTAAVAHLRDAIEFEGWSDWAWIRWRPPFDRLQNDAGYAALLQRHGRNVGAPAGVEADDAN
jgi:hypothetical protein